MSRRGANEGSIRHRPDGRWEARVMLTTPEGVRKRKSLLGQTRSEARDKLAAALRDEAAGRPTVSDRLTMGVFLDRWLQDRVSGRVRPSTYRSYQGIVRVHLIPTLGSTPIAKLDPDMVQRMLNDKAASGLAPRSVRTIRAVLRRALRHAEQRGLISRNAAALADPPRIVRRSPEVLTPDEARRLIEAIAGDPLEGVILVALGTGMRQGEILGLAWDDVDLETGRVTVRFALQRVDGHLQLVEPKSATSRRVVALPAIVVDALRRQRFRQQRQRLLAGSHWRDDPRRLVFTTSIGTPMDGITVTRRFQRLLRRSGLRRQRFHDLRHACASLLLAQGVAPRVVMETLGHSQISLTLDTYSHVLPELGRAAADQMDLVLGAPSSRVAS
jgi:integrase